MMSIMYYVQFGLHQRSRSSNIAIAIILRLFFQTKIDDHLAIAEKRSPIGHALELHDYSKHTTLVYSIENAYKIPLSCMDSMVRAQDALRKIFEVPKRIRARLALSKTM